MLMLGFASVFPWGLPWAPLRAFNSSPSGVGLRKFISDEFPSWCKYSWSPLGEDSHFENYWFLQPDSVSLRKRTQNFFHIFTKSICFSTFYRETPQGSLLSSWKGGSKWGTLRCQLPLRGVRPPQRVPALLIRRERGDRVNSLQKLNASLRLEHQKWLFSIATTGRWHNVYKPSLGHGAEPLLGH